MFKRFFLIAVAIIFVSILNSCKKEDFNPSIPEGTKFANINFKGFTIDRMQVRIGPRSTVAGELFENISGQSFQVPFAKDQNLNRVVFYKEDGSAPYATSQINFLNPARDTSLSIFYDGKTFFKNPTFPVAPAGKMLFRVMFKSTAVKYTGMVDLELHQARSVLKTLDPGTPKERDTIITTVNTAVIAKKITNVKPTEFTDYIEVPAFNNPNPSITDHYVVYVYLPGTTNPLPYPTTNVVTDAYATFYTTQDYTAIITINDVRLNGKPNRIEYRVEDRMIAFL